jgi:hypothetical protein
VTRGDSMAETSAELQQELDQLQAAYKAAVDNWVAAIREEEALASGNHNVAELDKWEAAHFREHKLHKEVDYRKRLYEDALRREFFGF